MSWRRCCGRSRRRCVGWLPGAAPSDERPGTILQRRSPTTKPFLGGAGPGMAPGWRCCRTTLELGLCLCALIACDASTVRVAGLMSWRCSGRGVGVLASSVSVSMSWRWCCGLGRWRCRAVPGGGVVGAGRSVSALELMPMTRRRLGWRVDAQKGAHQATTYADFTMNGLERRILGLRQRRHDLIGCGQAVAVVICLGAVHFSSSFFSRCAGT